MTQESSIPTSTELSEKNHPDDIEVVFIIYGVNY